MLKSNLVLIDARLRDVEFIESSLTQSTDFVEFFACNDTFDSLKSKIIGSYSSVAIAQHNFAKPYCQILDSMYPGTILDIQNGDPELESWAAFIDFLIWLKTERGTTTVDLLACDLWASNDWKYIIGKLKEKTGLLIRASIDVTGADGNFILESDNVDTIGIYFTENILQYKYSFYYSQDIFYTKNAFNAPIALDPSAGLGTVTSDNLATFFGKRYNVTGTVPYSSWQNTALASDLSNVIHVCSNNHASAALLSTGRVVCWGWDLYGGNCSSVSASLTNIVKIVASNSAFAALRSDGNVYCWGSSDSYIDINTARTGNVPPSTVNLTGCSDIYANYNGFAALKTNKTVVAWGWIQSTFDTTTLTNVTKLFPCENSFAALSSSGYAVMWWYNGYSNTSGKITQTILDIYGSGNTLYCLCQNGSTLTVRDANNNVIFTLAAGTTVKRYVQLVGTNYAFHFSDNSARVNYNGTVTTYTNVVQIIGNDSGCMLLKSDGTVAAAADSRFGGNLNNVPAGANANICSLYATTGSFGALKSDGTFIYFGLMGTYSYYYTSATTTFQITYPNDYACLQNIKAVSSESTGGYIFTYNDGTIKRVGKYGYDAGFDASGLDAGTTATYTMPSLGNKNLHIYPFWNTAIAVQVTPYESILPLAGIAQNVSSTVTYVSNNQNRIAYRTKTYGLYSGSTLLSTFSPSGDSTFTYVFNNVSCPDYGTVSLTVKDVTTTIPFSMFSFNVTAAYTPPAPNPPTLTSATVSNGSAQINFTAGDSFGTTILGYKYSLNGGAYVWANELASPITISGLTNGTSYSVQLKAQNVTGLSNASNTLTGVIPSTVPSTPVITSITALSGGLDVNFSEIGNGGASITNYYYSLNSGSYVLATSTSTGLIHITGLTNGTAYTVSVKTENANGQSAASLTSAQYTPCSVPSAPTISGVVAGDKQITVSFSAPANNGSAITSYSYNLYTDGSASTYAVAPIIGNATSFIIPGLVNGTSYSVKMKATNSIGSSAESSLSSTAIPYTTPSAPVITSATAGDRTVSIYYTAGNAGGKTITGYKYTVNTNPTLFDASATNPLVFTGLDNGTSYYYAIYAVTSAGLSPVSNTSPTVIPYKAPNSPSIDGATVSASQSSASIAFTPGNINGPGSIIGYKYSLDGSNYLFANETSSPLNIYGLNYGQTYRARIMAVTSTNLSSAASSLSGPFIPYTVPSAPSISQVTTGNGMIYVYVTDGSANGRDITAYKYSLNDGSYNSAPDNANPIPITGLTNGVSYSVKVKSVNLAGDSLPSSSSSAVTPYAIQGAPTISGYTAGNGSVTLAITNTSLNGAVTNGYAITGYKYSIDEGATYSSTVSTSDPASLTITGLTNGSSYSFMVKSVTSLGVSSDSNLYGPIVPVCPSQAPVIQSVVPSNYVADVYFVDGSSNGGSEITKYKYSLNDGPEYIALSTTNPIRIYGLTNAVSYKLKLKAVNAAGDSIASNESNAFVPYGIPYAATISKILPGNGCVYVYFNPIDNNGSEILGFRYSIGATPIDISGTTSPLTIPNLTNKTKYTISIYSYNAAGQSAISTNRVDIVPGVPEAPVITDVVPGAKSLKIYFNAPNDNSFAITQYMFGFGNAVNTLKAIGTTSPITVAGLLNGSSYDVYLVATNKHGNSAKSNQLGNKIPYDVANKVIITAVTPSFNSLLVAFTPPANNGSVITKYKYALNADTTFIDMSGTVSPILITGVPNNALNTVKMIAVNAAGDSPVSGNSKAAKYVYLPPAQIKVTSMVPSYQTLTVNFVAPLANGATITTYKYSLNSGPYVDANTTTLPLIINDVSNNVNYNIQVTAVNSAGESIPSALLAKPVQYIYLPPLAPAINSITPGNANAVVSFIAPITRNAPITGYKYSLNGGSSYVLSDASANANTLTINGLVNDTSYNFVLKATSDAGDSLATAPKVFTPVYKAPDAPVIGTLLALTKQLVINFAAPSANGSPITNYDYTFDKGVTVYSGNTATSPVTISGLTTGTSYSVQIRATNALGNSAWSAAKPGVPK